MNEPIFTCTSDPSNVMRDAIFIAHLIEHVPDYEQLVAADKAKKAEKEKEKALVVKKEESPSAVEFEQPVKKKRGRPRKNP